MEKYKPGYLGKVIPANDSSKMNDFMINKFDAFSKLYDVCKNQSDTISDIKVVDTGNTSLSALSVKISTDKKTVDIIKENTKNDSKVLMNNDVITATT